MRVSCQVKSVRHRSAVQFHLQEAVSKVVKLKKQKIGEWLPRAGGRGRRS